jgi:hypothetical protein
MSAKGLVAGAEIGVAIFATLWRAHSKYVQCLSRIMRFLPFVNLWKAGRLDELRGLLGVIAEKLTMSTCCLDVFPRIFR